MSKKILVLHEQRDMGHTIAGQLRQAGYEATVPVDSYVALELAITNTCSLIIFDEQMPLLNGDGFIRTLREASVQTPVILLTGAQQPEDRPALQALGVADFIPKPFQMDRVMKSVAQILANRV